MRSCHFTNSLCEKLEKASLTVLLVLKPWAMPLQPGPSTPRRVPSRPAPTPRGVSASVGAPTAASAGGYGPAIHGRPSGGRRPSGRYPRRYVARATKLTVIDELDRRKVSPHLPSFFFEIFTAFLYPARILTCCRINPGQVLNLEFIAIILGFTVSHLQRLK